MHAGTVVVDASNLIQWIARGQAQCGSVNITLHNADQGFVALLVSQAPSPLGTVENSWLWVPEHMDSFTQGDDGYFVNVRCTHAPFEGSSSPFQISMTQAPSPAPTPQPMAYAPP